MNKRKTILIIVALLAVGVGGRLLPHLPNATPLIAIALVSSVYMGKRWSLILPVAALAISDILIGLYDWRIMLSVYGSIALVGLLSWAGRKWKGVVPLFFTLVGSSLLFFLVTNAAVWAFSPWYEKTTAGLLYAYTLGLPFWRNMLAGDLVYSVLLFGIFEAARVGAGWRKLRAATVTE